MSLNLMSLLTCSLAALAVAGIFYYYRSYLGELRRRQRMLRERVAYMLWVAAKVARD